MATAAASSAAEPEVESKAGPQVGAETEGEEDKVKDPAARRKVLSRAAAAAATCKAAGPAWDPREEGESESDGDEEYAMASSAESSPGEYEWEYDEEEEKNQLEIERLEEQVGVGVPSGLLSPGDWTWEAPLRPNIWLEYGQYSVGGIGQKGGLEKVRSVFERALSSVGLHLTKGLAIWEAYREFESAIVEAARVRGLCGELRGRAVSSWLERSVLKWNLALPLANMEATFAEYEEWSEDPIPEPVVQSYHKALQQLEKYKPYEEALVTRSQDRQLKVKDLVLSVHSRAVRNCPWTVALWSRYLLAMERYEVDHLTIAETFEKALSAGFIQATDYVEIWQAYLDYLRRRVDFQQAKARLCKNMQKARELWDSIMTKGNAKYANMWLEYYNLERAHGDTQHCRKALHRAVQCTSDYPEHVCEVLLTMERTEGTLEDWDIAVQKTETRLARVNEQRIKAAEKEAVLAQQEEAKSEQRKRARAEKKAQKKKKSRASEDAEREWGDEEQPSKRRRVENSVPPATAAQGADTEAELPGRRAPAEVGPPSKQKEKAAALKRDMARVPHDSRKDGITVFVSNLPYSMSEPDTKLQPLFEACGEVAEIRPIFSNRGDFRGYCYVEFKDEKSALQALELDRRNVEGRPMFVSPCVDKSKNPDFKVFRYSTALEKHKVFISGLPFSCTREELEELCQAHGTVKDLRLVTNRAGKPKGLAYVEFENESQASQAVLKMDGMTVKENVIKVAISNPPQRKAPEKPEARKAPGGPLVPRQIYGARGKGRTQLSLLPRALQRPSTTTSQAENGPASHPADANSTLAEAPKMSNADFAKLLLRK
ncbi:squamous cell carcinoma antigen recognized by T-cells 3 [Echinops telfairi]|uniref:Squamous cell carcinoma antigen recognized by T-cells 3 n=1 Tax=Echinops telfairi TaxID=9371 RepID=A0AC55DLJ7_ECHTE|nr:squamous cell carcinoma antigen recognized by T-cells 3 [Echinops telfairi]